MSKNAVRGYITLAVLFIVLSIVAFAAPFSRTAVFWLGYSFGIVAILFQIYIFKISFSGDGNRTSKFYGIPIARIGVVYLIVQLLISIAEMAAAFLPAWAALIVNIIPVSLAVIGCIAADTMKNEIIRQDTELKKNVGNMRKLQSMAAALAGQCPDGELKKLLQNITEEFKFSDPVSSEQTLALESDMQQQMNEIQNAVLEEDISSAKVLCNKTLASLAERNRLCSLNK